MIEAMIKLNAEKVADTALSFFKMKT